MKYRMIALSENAKQVAEYEIEATNEEEAFAIMTSIDALIEKKGFIADAVYCGGGY